MQRAARFFCLQRLAFDGVVAGQSFGVSATTPARLKQEHIEDELSLAHRRLACVTIKHLPRADCIERHDREQSLFFCDPPYWQIEGYGVKFGFEQYELLAETLAGLRDRAMLTINHHPDMRRVFDHSRRRRFEIGYAVGSQGTSKAKAGELIYCTW